MSKQKIKFIVTTVIWADRKNHCYYHSMVIQRTSDGKKLHREYKSIGNYGISLEAGNALFEAKWIPQKYQMNTMYYYEEQENKPIAWVTFFGTKKQCKEFGKKGSRFIDY